MQSSPTSTSVRRPAVQQGLIFGIIIGIVFAINSILGYFVNLGPGSGAISFALFLIGLVLYALAGYRTSVQTGRASSGTIAGLLTGAIGGVIGLVVNMIIVFATVDRLRQASQAAADQLRKQSPQQFPVVHYTNGTVIFSILLLAIGLLALAIGLGAGFGAIGGVIGRRRAPAPTQAYQESFYQGLSPTPSEQLTPYPPNPANPNEQPYNQPYNQPDNQPPQQTIANPPDSYNQNYPPQQPPSSNQ